jgi:hypothetical protein
MILSELALSQRRPNTTNQRQRTITSVERPTEGQGLGPAFAIALGCVLAVVVNLLGTRYETTTVSMISANSIGSVPNERDRVNTILADI